MGLDSGNGSLDVLHNVESACREEQSSALHALLQECWSPTAAQDDIMVLKLEYLIVIGDKLEHSFFNFRSCEANPRNSFVSTAAK